MAWDLLYALTGQSKSKPSPPIGRDFAPRRTQPAPPQHAAPSAEGLAALEAAAAKHRDLRFRKTEAPVVESKEEPPCGAPPTPDKVRGQAPARRPTVLRDDEDMYVVAIAGDEAASADYAI